MSSTRSLIHALDDETKDGDEIRTGTDSNNVLAADQLGHYFFFSFLCFLKMICLFIHYTCTV
jgi:hypothetical protein